MSPGQIEATRRAVVDEAHELVRCALHDHRAEQFARESPIPPGICPARRINADAHQVSNPVPTTFACGAREVNTANTSAHLGQRIAGTRDVADHLAERP